MYIHHKSSLSFYYLLGSDHAANEHAGHSHGMGCEIEPMTDYNMPLRIGSLFIILGTSAVGKPDNSYVNC
jgi:hypothetical protein